MSTSDENIRLNAGDIANKLGASLPDDLGFVLILFHKSGERGQYMGLNVPNQLALKMLEKAQDAAITDSLRTLRPG